MTKPILWNKEIEEIKNSGYLNKDRTVTDALVESFYNSILKDNEKALFEMAFSENPTQEDLNNLLNIWDIEVKGSAKSLILAYIMKMHPKMKFTQYEAPRLKGLLKYYRFDNLGKIAHFTKIGRVLNSSGITPMILNGGAIKFLRQDLPRAIGGFDILISEKDFKKTAKYIRNLGYTFTTNEYNPNNIGIFETETNVLNIHKRIALEIKNEKKFLSNLYSRAKEEDVFGIKCLVPSGEDLLFLILVNLACSVRYKTTPFEVLYNVFDCKFLQESKNDFDWNIIKENAKITGLRVQTNISMKLLKKISANVLPSLNDEEILFEKETNSYSNMIIFERLYLDDLRTKCRAMKIGNVIKNPNLWLDYIILKPKYQLQKCFRKHPLLIKFFIKDLKTHSFEFDE